MADAAPDADVDRAYLDALAGRPVKDLSLYERALTHRSLLRNQEDLEQLASNERLEFLGDAVLGCVVAEALYRQFPDEDEGYLTRLRARLVSGRALAASARRAALGTHLRLSENMVRSGGRQNRSLLAGAFEAVIGALYLDLGFAAARDFVEAAVLEDVSLPALAEQQENYKSLLLEYAQARAEPQPRYRIVREEGPAHDKTFTVEVLLDSVPSGTGTDRSKKSAEQKAAREALVMLRAKEAAASD